MYLLYIYCVFTIYLLCIYYILLYFTQYLLQIYYIFTVYLQRPIYKKSQQPGGGNGTFFHGVEIINEGDICCIGYGEICAMDTFAKLLDRTYCLELDNDWFFNAIKFLTTDNVAVFINDCFDDDGYNVEGICFRLDDKWSRQFEVVALRIILPGEEFFMRYGREYWCYRLHFESLTVAQQHKCSYFYEINM